METGRREGRPLKFETVKLLEERIEDYFDVTSPENVTITGLALHLDCSRMTLLNYEDRPEYFAAVKRAKDRVQLEYELDLRRKGRSGDIFALKNFGWRDERSTEHKGGINFIINEGSESQPVEPAREPEENTY